MFNSFLNTFLVFLYILFLDMYAFQENKGFVHIFLSNSLDFINAGLLDKHFQHFNTPVPRNLYFSYK